MAVTATEDPAVGSESLGDYHWERNGDQFSFAWKSAGIAIGVDQLHESREELYGEVWVKSSLPDQPSHVHWGRLNLSSSTTRERLAATLRRRINLPWEKMLESVCTRTALEYRRGDPILDLSTLDEPDTAKYLLPRLLPAGSTTIFFGDGDSCKSMLALCVAIAVKTGWHMPNVRVATETGPVLYLDWETCKEDQQERLLAMRLGLMLDDVPQIYYRKQTRLLADDIAQLRVEVAKRHIKLVIIDSLGPAVGGGMRDEEKVIPAMNAINSLGTTALCLAHITKADARNENSKATPLGSVFFNNLARCSWEVRRAEDSTDNSVSIGLYHRKSNRGPRQRDPLGYTFCFHNDAEGERTVAIELKPFEVAEDEDLASHAPLHYRLMALLRTGSKSVDDLANKTNTKADTVGRTLQRMEQNGNVVCITGGKGRSGLSMWGLRAAAHGGY